MQPQSSIRWLVLIIALAAVTRLAAYSGFVSSDDWRYLTSAAQLASGDDISTGGHWQCRTGVTVPAAVFHATGAPSWLILGGMTFFWSLLCVLIAYWVSIEFTTDKRVGLLSALLIAVFPLDVIYATCLYPHYRHCGDDGLDWAVFYSRQSYAVTS